MRIKIKYTTSGGKERTIKLKKNPINIDLHDAGITTIDLTPLQNCSTLQTLTLSNNQLQHIDLSPLSSCHNLSEVYLDKNQLEDIVFPSWNNLRELNLQQNHLVNFDLKPLSDCRPRSLRDCQKLKLLNLVQNRMKSIDLIPLRYCEGPLRFCDGSWQLELGGYEDLKVDITPVFDRVDVGIVGFFSIYSWLPNSARTIGVPRYSRPMQLYPWDFLYHVISEFPHDYRIQHDVFYALGLGDYGFVDRDLTDLMLSLGSSTSTEDAREAISKVLLQEIVQSVDNDGITTGLNLAALSLKHGEIAGRAKKIIEVRMRELEQIRVSISREKKIDLRELAITAYGFNILNALDTNLGFYVEKYAFKQIDDALLELGVKLRMGKTKKSGVKMSRELRKCIFWILEMKDKSYRPKRSQV